MSEYDKQAIAEGRKIAHNHIDNIVDAVEKADMSWTSHSAFFDMSSEILNQLKSKVDEEVLKRNRPSVVEGIQRELRESGRFVLEKRSPSHHKDPASEYQRVSLKE
jgi:hypothetical protein